jgi:ATP-dependent Clp protease ATP-binding subunit ClpA
VKSTELVAKWRKNLVGQNHAIDVIIPYINRYRANLHMPRRTVGNFFLTGPTGTGKTRTPETLARVLHGDERNVLVINCETFQADHEVAKLIGSPPGYLGHKETIPMLSQAKINAVSSEECNISIILFDEIDKASAALWRMLLNILDKAELRLGDNSTSDFQNCLIFMTSNKGSVEISRELYGGFGFDRKERFDGLTDQAKVKLEKLGRRSIEDGFSPEFFNRIDETIVYRPLTQNELVAITELELSKIASHIQDRLGKHAFLLEYGAEAVDAISKLGTDSRYGARFLKRTIDKLLFNPLCNAYLDGDVTSGSVVTIIRQDETVNWNVALPSVIDIDEALDEFLQESGVVQ